MSQKNFAKALGLGSGQLTSNWERGYGSPMPISALKRMIKVFDLDSEDTLEAYIHDAKERLAKKIRAKIES